MKRIKIRAKDGDIFLILKDDGRIFYDVNQYISSNVKESVSLKKDILPYVLFSVLQVELLVFAILRILEII